MGIRLQEALLKAHHDAEDFSRRAEQAKLEFTEKQKALQSIVREAQMSAAAAAAGQ